MVSFVLSCRVRVNDRDRAVVLDASGELESAEVIVAESSRCRVRVRM